MPFIFKTIDKTGRVIHLTGERWSHISGDHPEIAPHFDKLEDALRHPTRICSNNEDISVRHYYKYLKNKTIAQYLLLIVKYLNGSGFIITAYFVKNIR